MTSKLKTFGVLMWKHCISRKRRFIVTPIELLSPCLFFIFLFSVRSYLQNATPKSAVAKGPILQNTTALLLDNVKSPSLLLYHPKSELTDILMDEVGSRLNLQRLNTFPDIKDKRSRGYYPLDIESFRVTDEIAESMKYTTAIILFENMEANGTWPTRLNYTIRMKNDFMTHVYKALDDETGPHERFGTIYEPFMRLQWTIDSSYLRLLTGNEVTQRVSIQEFPYVKRLNQNMSTLDAFILLLQNLSTISLIMPFVFLMARLIEERANGAQELTKMCGVSNTMIGFAHFLNSLPVGLMYAISGAVLLTVSDKPLLRNTSALFLFVLFILHFLSVMSIAFAANCLIKTAQYSTTMSFFAFMITIAPIYKLHDLDMHQSWRPFLGMAPHAPVYMFLDEVRVLEKYGQSTTFSNMWTRHSDNGIPVGHCYIYMTVQCLFFFVLAGYLNVVCPGKYGVPLPWNYCLKLIYQSPLRNQNGAKLQTLLSMSKEKIDTLTTMSFWSKKKVTPSLIDDNEEEPISTDSQYFEDPPPNAEVGIKISNVSKVYGSKRVLSHVSLEVLKGEITVLLGHNGAGKTTLMSIITGMLQPTEGGVYIGGEDVSDDSFRQKGAVGMCPQHNLFFSDLTVLEHAMFFAMLRGTSYNEAKESSKKLLDQLNLIDKANNKSGELSGGMKRRLQLVCALAGGSEVLILDEPTSGLDVETRRELWDLLLSLRGTRTVLLSTHFMEEADALGDRAAAIHSGTLKCHATPMFLKKKIGTGYRLSLTTIGIPKDTAILAVITKIIPDASIKDKTGNSLTIALPSQDSNKFPNLFTALENKRSELGVDSIGVGVSTLEEVFLKLCSDATTNVDDFLDGGPETEEYRPKTTTTGLRLVFRQFYYLVQRQIKYVLRKKYSFLVMQFLLPVGFIISISITMNRKGMGPDTMTAVKLINIDMYDKMPERRVLYRVANDSVIRPIAARYKDVIFEKAPDVTDVVLRTGERDPMKYNSYLAGVELDNDNNAKVLYTTVVRHAAPVAMNLLSNMLAAQYMPWAEGNTITTSNYPIENNLSLRSVNLVQPAATAVCAVWTAIIVFLIHGTLSNNVNLPIMERNVGTRHIHIMTGCSPTLYWFTTLFTNSVYYVVSLGAPTVIVQFLDETKTLNEIYFLGTLALILVAGTVSFLAYAYLISFPLSERTSGLFLALTILVFGIMTAAVKFSSERLVFNTGIWRVPITMISYMSPSHSFATAIFKATGIARQNAMCTLNQENCGMVSALTKMKDFDNLCCEAKGQNPLMFLTFENDAPLREIIIMLCQTLVYMVLVILTQHGVFNGLTDMLANISYVRPISSCSDEVVLAEKTYVSKAIELPKAQITDSMLLHDAHKRYFRYLHPTKPCAAVRGISFSVKKGECFGLLGVNGAGKSTTFKMLTTEETPTRGTIFANGHKLKTPRTAYLRSLGYCPQDFGLDGFLTGRENLSLLLTLRGYDAVTVRTESESWIEVVGLRAYADQQVRGYSGGCARRLAAALALCIGAATTLLDEPTAGVDVAARRNVWAALRRGLAQRRAVLITSHSMDEMESLCDRIAIMSTGQICALGGAPQLRAAYAAGHSVIIKLTHAAVDVSGSADILKRQLHEKFNCSLKDEHKSMLHYHINDTMRYSELFTILEKLKDDNSNIIEDYSVTETTLEEVFLSFAKPQTESRESVASV